MEQLVWLVQVKWPSNGYFESIAAFDCQPAAERYALICSENNGELRYRVRNLQTTEVVWRDDS